MKRAITWLLAAAMLFALAACAAGETPAPAAEPEKAETKTEAAVQTAEPAPAQEPETKEEGPVKTLGIEYKSNEATSWDDDGELNVLAIGSSFSDDTLWYVRDIAKSAGIEKINVFNLHYPGCTIAQHAAHARMDEAVYQFQNDVTGTWTMIPNYKMSAALRFKKWDYISFHQSVHLANNASTFEEMPWLLGYVRDIVGPEPRFIYLMNWAYQGDCTTNPNFMRFRKDQALMFDSIIEGTKANVEPWACFEYIVPNATAVQNLRTSFLGDTVTRDGYHMNYLEGRYTVGLTYFGMLMGPEWLDKVTFKPENVQKNGGVIEGEGLSSMDEKTQAVCIEAAKNAIAHPYEITQATDVG